jgi:hypothetical protein
MLSSARAKTEQWVVFKKLPPEMNPPFEIYGVFRTKTEAEQGVADFDFGELGYWIEKMWTEGEPRWGLSSTLPKVKYVG